MLFIKLHMDILLILLACPNILYYILWNHNTRYVIQLLCSDASATKAALYGIPQTPLPLA